MLSDCFILVFCKTTMSCTFTECSTNWLTTYGPNPRNHLSAGFILHIACTHNHHVYTQFQEAQYITRQSCVQAFGIQLYKTAFSWTCSQKTQHFSQQLTTRVKDGKWALLLQQKLPINQWSQDGREQPKCDCRNSVCVRTAYLCSFCSSESRLLCSPSPLSLQGWICQPCHRTLLTFHSLSRALTT